MTNLSAAPVRPSQLGDEAELFAQLNTKLFHTVRKQVNADDALIEDACGFAWTQLLRYQPSREHVFGWLRLTAVREAWDLSARERRAIPLNDEITPDRRSFTATDLELQIDARDALRAVATLDPVRRRTDSRHIAGLSYAEIAAENQQTTRQIQRHLRRARPILDAARGENSLPAV